MNTSTRFFRMLAALGLALAAGAAMPADTPKAAPRDPQGLDTRVQSLKQEAMEINRDLLVLEEEHEQVAIDLHRFLLQRLNSSIETLRVPRCRFRRVGRHRCAGSERQPQGSEHAEEPG